MQLFMKTLLRSFSLLDTGLGTYRIWTLICAVFFPAVCAVAVFGALFRADGKRKLTVYFITLPVYFSLTAFVFTDLAHSASIFVPDAGNIFSDVSGFISALAFGIVYLGINVLICSPGVMKISGRTAAAVMTVIFFTIEALTVVNVIIVSPSGKPAPSTGSVFPFVSRLPKPFDFLKDLIIDVPAAAIAVLCIVLLFLCFFANKTSAEIRNDDIAALRKSRKKAGKAEEPADKSECSVCRYASHLKTDKRSVLCEYHGIIAPDGFCDRFEYDPLKRIPERKKHEKNG